MGSNSQKYRANVLIDRQTNDSHGHSINGTRFLPDGTLQTYNTKYTVEQHYEAVAYWIVYGNLKMVEKMTGIPSRTLSDWRHSEWWAEIAQQVQEEQEDEIRAKNSQIILKCQEEIFDRLTNGEVVLDKEGAEKRVPVKAKDAAIIGSISFDKNRIIQGKPTSISASASLEQQLKRFQEIAAKEREKKIENAIVGEYQADDSTATP